jgi:monofunctional biosynthetic peptidoglycan transglycosylase
VLSAEDARFYQHGGFDWKEVDNAIQEDLENGRKRGASTIDQQLARNLFLSTAPSVVRKAMEFSIVPLGELVLPKRRILELYLNVVEWGPGIYGAEAAAETYYHQPARRISRQQALELASILPAPSRRRPGHTEWYVQRIDERMRQAGW